MSNLSQANNMFASLWHRWYTFIPHLFRFCLKFKVWGVVTRDHCSGIICHLISCCVVQVSVLVSEILGVCYLAFVSLYYIRSAFRCGLPTMWADSLLLHPLNMIISAEHASFTHSVCTVQLPGEKIPKVIMHFWYSESVVDICIPSFTGNVTGACNVAALSCSWSPLLPLSLCLPGFGSTGEARSCLMHVVCVALSAGEWAPVH